MKKTLLSLSILTNLSLGAQTSLYTDDFETTTAWSLPGATTSLNQWVINGVYQGGTENTGLGSVTIPDVPSQPTTFSNPDQNYLHPDNGLLTTISNANYTIPLIQPGSIDVVGNTDVNTTGYENIQVSYYRTGGSGGLDLIYSTDGGNNWSVAQAATGNYTIWQIETVTLPAAAENINNLRIGFRITESGLLDPAPNHYHSIDEIEITGDPATLPETLTHTIQGSVTDFCGGDDIITVDYTGTNGTYNAANEFQLELSDASGSFASPTTIGTLASTSATGIITGSIPTGVTAGTGYRVRVVSTDNAFTGADNGADLTMNPKPAAPVVTQNGTTLSSDYASGNQWYMDGTMINGETGQDYTATAGGDYYTIHTSAAGCESDPSNTITIDFTSVIEEEAFDVSLYPNPFNNEFTVVSNSASTVTVVTLTGQVIAQFDTIEKEVVSTNDWNAGVFFVKVQSANNTSTFKVLKR